MYTHTEVARAYHCSPVFFCCNFLFLALCLTILAAVWRTYCKYYTLICCFSHAARLAWHLCSCIYDANGGLLSQLSSPYLLIWGGTSKTRCFVGFRCKFGNAAGTQLFLAVLTLVQLSVPTSVDKFQAMSHLLRLTIFGMYLCDGPFDVKTGPDC